MELPETIALFPLPNVVLFPHVDLPLHIFEPRYREMVRDAMEGDRLIGMTLLRGDWRSNYQGSPQIYPLGCVGRIETFAALPDGRSNILLRGVSRFEIVEELAGRSYRRARVRWCPEAESGDSTVDVRTAQLKTCVERFLASEENPLPTDLWDRLPEDPAKLVDVLAFGLPLEVVEKMALLECSGARARADRLVEIVEFRLAERASRLGGPSDEGRWH
jgi:Lon protease-like protein